MGFFNDLKEDLAAAVNELTEENAQKELADSENRLKEEIAMFEKEDKGLKKKKKNKNKNASLEQEIQNILNGIDENEEVNSNDAFESLVDEINEDIINEEEAIDDTLTTDVLDMIECDEPYEGVSVSDGFEEIPASNEDLAVDSDEIPASVDSDVETNETIQDSLDLEELVEEEIAQDILEESVEEVIEEQAYEPEVTVSETVETPSYSENKEANILTKGNKIMSDQITVITKGTSIKGDIISDGGIEIYGSVTGSIDAQGKIVVSGEISGDSKGSEIFVDGAKIHGNLDSEGTVKIANESIIIGNIKAACAVIAGAVKGNIDVNGPVVLDSTAKVLGDIDCKLVQINNGAVIEGKCSQSYAEVSPSSFFENL